MNSQLLVACISSFALLPSQSVPESPAVCETPSTTRPAAPSTRPAGIVKVDVEQFDELRADPNAIVLDVRTPKEFEAGHLPGAINLSATDKSFDAEVAKLDKRKTYLVHCKTGKRSDVAVHKMQTMGFATLYDLSGGYVAWTAAAKPVEDDADSK